MWYSGSVAIMYRTNESVTVIRGLFCDFNPAPHTKSLQYCTIRSCSKSEINYFVGQINGYEALLDMCLETHMRDKSHAHLTGYVNEQYRKLACCILYKKLPVLSYKLIEIFSI